MTPSPQDVCFMLYRLVTFSAYICTFFDARMSDYRIIKYMDKLKEIYIYWLPIVVHLDIW